MDHQAIDWAVVDAALAGDGRGPGADTPERPSNGGPLRRVTAHVVWVVIAVSTAVVVLAATALIVAATPPPTVSLDDAAGSAVAASAQPSPLLVDVEGAVRHPGVVRLPAGSRVADAILAAGGYSGAIDAAAASSQLDLADPLQDGAKVLVPQRGSSSAAGSGPSPQAGKVDLNRATAAELDALPGIGPVTAARIIASRVQQPFRRVDDLRTRKLVGASTFAKLQALVTI